MDVSQSASLLGPEGEVCGIKSSSTPNPLISLSLSERRIGIVAGSLTSSHDLLLKGSGGLAMTVRTSLLYPSPLTLKEEEWEQRFLFGTVKINVLYQLISFGKDESVN